MTSEQSSAERSQCDWCPNTIGEGYEIEHEAYDAPRPYSRQRGRGRFSEADTICRSCAEKIHEIIVHARAWEDGIAQDEAGDLLRKGKFDDE